MIVQKNLYLPGQDLTNLAQNVDYNRYQDFKGTITVNFGTVPATVTVKVGTILEVNGNLYAIETADYVFSMDNATHNYLTFTDNPGVDFGSAAAIGTYSAAKQGYYQAGNLIRTLPFYIDQANSEVSRLMDEQYNLNRPRMKLFDRVFVIMSNSYSNTVSHVLRYNTKVFDELGNFNTGTYTFTASESGWYIIGFTVSYELGNENVNKSPSAYIRINGTPITGACSGTGFANVFTNGAITVQAIYYLKKTDTVDFWFFPFTSGLYNVVIKSLDQSNAYRAASAHIMRVV